MAPRSSRATDAAASSRQRIIDYLSSRGGRITSPDGRGLTSSLAKAAGYTDLGVLNAMLSRLEKEGVISRDVRGRRTFGISLGGRRSAAGATKAGATKTAAKKTAAKKTAAKKTAAKKTAAKKTTARKAR